MKQPTELEISGLVSQILQSPEFHESKRYQELLQYLVNKSSKVTTLKETEIAQEVFGKDSKFDPSSDPLIRSYVSNLRKKLEHYYLTTDHQVSFRLEIPKGQYLVRFTPSTKRILPRKPRSMEAVLFLIILGLTAIIVIRDSRNAAPSTSDSHGALPNPIWSDFITNSIHPTLIVIGDFLVLSDKQPSERRTFLRDPRINSSKELREQIKLAPEQYGKYHITDITFIGAGAAVGVVDVVKALKGASNLEVKLSSQLKWDDFENRNIIYVGTLKTLDKLDTLFSRTNIRFTLSPNTLKIARAENDTPLTLRVVWQGGSYQKDYSIVMKLRGSKNNSIMFLTGFSEVGVMESIKASTDPAILARINKFGNAEAARLPGSFELISEVEGVGHTVFRSDIRYYSTLDAPAPR